MGTKDLFEVVPDDCPNDFLCCENEGYELMSTLDTPQVVENNDISARMLYPLPTSDAHTHHGLSISQ